MSRIKVKIPVFQINPGDDDWYFWTIAGNMAGPYSTREKAEQRYEEYRDYTEFAPTCHHP